MASGRLVLVCTLAGAVLVGLLSHATATTAPARKGPRSPWLGIYMETAPSGVRILRVFPGTPAERHGLRAGDILLAIDGRRVRTPARCREVLMGYLPGSRIRVTLFRSGTKKDFWVVLGSRPSDRELQRQVLLRQPAPSFSYRTLDGRVRHSSGLQGRWVLLEFWSPFCGACLARLPLVSSWARRYRPRGLDVLLLTSAPEKTLGRVPGLPIHLVGLVAEATKAAFLVAYLPTFVLLDPRGVVSGIWWGASERTVRAVEAAIVRLLSSRRLPRPRARGPRGRPRGRGRPIRPSERR